MYKLTRFSEKPENCFDQDFENLDEAIAKAKELPQEDEVFVWHDNVIEWTNQPTEDSNGSSYDPRPCYVPR